MGYLDGFVLPIPRDRVEDYQRVAAQVASVWREHGALDYREYLGDDLSIKGLRSFVDAAGAKPHEAVVFGYALFASREARDLANEKVSADPRMEELIAPLLDPSAPVFDPGRMAFGGFRPLVPAVES